MPGSWHQVAGTGNFFCGPTGNVPTDIAPLSYTACVRYFTDAAGDFVYQPAIFVHNRNPSRQFRIVGTTLQSRVDYSASDIRRFFVDCPDSTIAADGRVMCWPRNDDDLFEVHSDSRESTTFAQIAGGPTVASPKV